MKSNWKGAWGILLSVALLVGVPWLRAGHAQEGGGAQNGSAVFNTGVGTAPDSFVRGRVLVKFRGGVSDARARGLLEAYGAHTANRIPGIGVQVVELPPTAVEEHFVLALERHSEVEFAELDRILPPAVMSPNDPWYGSEWHLPKISASSAWDISTGSSSIIIAVLDSGVDGRHEDLTDNMVAGWNVYSNNSDTADVNNHGTHVAGTAAAKGNNAMGVAAVAWNCKIMPIRVSDPSGYATYSAIASGLSWAADHGARVANVSFIVSGSSAVKSAAQYFQNNGGVVVASAGNYSTFDSAADNPYILTVSATNISDQHSDFSNYGNNVDLAAPEAAYTTQRGGGYVYAGGTSFSAPIVAGVAALVLSVNPSLTGAQVQDILKQNADDLGSAGWDMYYGWGRVNAARALQAARGNADTSPPSVSIGSPADGAAVSGIVNVGVSASDDFGVSSVSLSVDGNPLGTDTASPYTFQWDTTRAANGLHTLTATVSDAAGNSSNAHITVSVANGAPSDGAAPTVVIVSPTDGGRLSTNTTVSVNASDNVGVVKNELYVDGKLTAAATAAPFTTKWNSRKAAAGRHTLQCKAYDAAGNSSWSQVVAVYK